MSKLFIVVPCYNEEEVLGSVSIKWTHLLRVFFETNPLSSCFMISDNRQTKTV